ncbi:MAG: type II secretion system protein [Gammaproteobacteria bacterium]|nr:type II secretion system protein [Gammaproteobacteria bacterium]
MMRQAGFTLLELVTIIVLVGVVSTFAALRSGSDFTALGDAEELIQAIRYTQERAMHHTGDGSNYRITLSAAGYSLTPAATSVYRDSLDGVLRGSSINPTGSIQFDGLGLPSCSGGLDCAGSSESIQVSAQGETTSLTLEPYTGFVRR